MAPLNRPDIEIKDVNNLSSEEEKLKFIISLAHLAPSSHNSQPWLFRFGQKKILLLADPNRRLPASDKMDRQFYLSLGAVLGNLKLVLESYGIGFKVNLPTDGEVVAEIEYEDLIGRKMDQETLTAIVNRHNGRHPFENKQIPEEIIGKIKQFENNELRIDVVTDSNLRQKIQEIVADAIEAAFLDKGFTTELSIWMKPSLKKYKDGMTGYNLGVPWLMSFVLPWMVKNIDVSKQQRKMNYDLLAASTAFVTISSKKDNRLGWIEAGEVFDRIAVALEKDGIRTSAQGAPIEIGNYYQKLQEILERVERPLMFFRIGYCDKVPPASPRLPLEKVITP